MTLGEFRELTKKIDPSTPLRIDANGNPLWYAVERDLADGTTALMLIDRSGISLSDEIPSALQALGTEKGIAYLRKNGVTEKEIASCLSLLSMRKGGTGNRDKNESKTDVTGLCNASADRTKRRTSSGAGSAVWEREEKGGALPCPRSRH